jgi:hypothetical protein
VEEVVFYLEVEVGALQPWEEHEAQCMTSRVGKLIAELAIAELAIVELAIVELAIVELVTGVLATGELAIA